VTASFDLWTVLFLCFAFLGAAVSALLWAQDGPRHRRWPVIAMLVLFSVTITDYALFWSRTRNVFPYLAPVTPVFYYLYGPLLLRYIGSLAHDRRSISWLHFLPAAAALSLSIPAAATVAAAGRLTASPLPLLTSVIEWGAIPHLVLYSVLIARTVQAFREHPRLYHWSLAVALFLVVFTVAYASYYMLVATGLLTPGWDYAVSAAMCLFISGIAYAGFVMPQLLNDEPPPLRPVRSKYGHSPVTERTAREIAERIGKAAREHAVWKRAHFGLEDLALLVGLPRHYVSQVLNEHMGMNFYEFMNGIRIAEAKRMLEDPAHRDTPVIDIAFSAGFNNKVSFYASFRNAAGMTPAEYKRRALGGVPASS